MTKKHIAILAGLVVLGLTLGYVAGLNRGAEQESRATTAGKTDAAPATPAARYAMNVVVSGVPFWNDTRSSWEAIGKSYPNTITTFGGPTDDNAQTQIDQIAAAIRTRSIDGLVVAPADSAALTTVIDQAVAAGIPVITYLVDAPKSRRLTYVASELDTGSKRVGEYVTATGPAGGDAIILFAKAGNEEQETRRRGFEQFIGNKPALHLVDAYQDGYDEKKSSSIVKTVLVKHPNVKYIFGCDSRSAIGAASALRELHYKPGQVVITGWDVDKDVLDLVRSGWVQASAAQQSTFMTDLIYSILDASHKNYLYPLNRLYKEHGVRPVPEQIVVPITVVTSSNVLGFYPK
jgi:ribose transport system substrate-binding protein